MHFMHTRSTAALAGAVVALGGVPALAVAAPAAQDAVTVVTPAPGATVGGARQAITIKAPLGTTPGYIQCASTIDMAPFAPTTWGAQASDGTIKGTVDVTHCTGGSNTLTVPYTGTVSGDASVTVNIANAGQVNAIGSTSDSFTPNGDHVADTVAVFGEYINANTVTATVKDARGHAVRRISADTWLETMGLHEYTATWDGRTSTGRIARPGRYTISVVATGDAGTSAPVSVPVTIARSRMARGAKQVRLAHTTQAATFNRPTVRGSQFQEQLMLQNGAELKVSVVDARGRTVVAPYELGHQFRDLANLAWDGRLSTGASAPSGRYTFVVSTGSHVVTKLPVTLTAS